MRRPLEIHGDEENPEKRHRTDQEGGSEAGSNEAGGNNAAEFMSNDIVEDEDPSSYKSDMAKFQAELGKDKPKRAAVKKLMKSTFIGRREWITKERPLIHVVLDKFPCLSQSKYVCKPILLFLL